MHARLSKHSSIVDPLEQSLKDFAASSTPALQHAAHSMVLATQALRHSIVQHHSCILALLSRPPPLAASFAPQHDPVLQALGSGIALEELFAAQRAVDDAAATAVAL
jgi:hypothetical protein